MPDVREAALSKQVRADNEERSCFSGPPGSVPSKKVVVETPVELLKRLLLISYTGHLHTASCTSFVQHSRRTGEKLNTLLDGGYNFQVH